MKFASEPPPTGGFERFGNDSQPGEWEPWILYVGGIWALVVALLASRMYIGRPAKEAELDRGAEAPPLGR